MSGAAEQTGVVRRGCAHTFWNAGEETARCLMVITPPGFEAYFRELAQLSSDEEANELRRRLRALYDIEVVGPPERSSDRSRRDVPYADGVATV